VHDSTLEGSSGRALYECARRIRSALLRMDLDAAGRAHLELRRAVSQATRAGLATERDRRWGRLAERMLARCQTQVRTAQERVSTELRSLDAGCRSAAAYRRSQDFLDRV